MTQQPIAPPEPTGPLRRLLRYAQPHRQAVILASTYSILNKVFDLAPPLLIGAAVDVVVTPQAYLMGKLGIQGSSAQLMVLG